MSRRTLFPCHLESALSCVLYSNFVWDLIVTNYWIHTYFPFQLICSGTYIQRTHSFMTRIYNKPQRIFTWFCFALLYGAILSIHTIIFKNWNAQSFRFTICKCSLLIKWFRHEHKISLTVSHLKNSFFIIKDTTGHFMLAGVVTVLFNFNPWNWYLAQQVPTYCHIVSATHEPTHHKRKNGI